MFAFGTRAYHTPYSGTPKIRYTRFGEPLTRVKSLSRHKPPYREILMESDFNMLHGNFITDEYTPTLRLESELSDLRVGYANPYPENL